MKETITFQIIQDDLAFQLWALERRKVSEEEQRVMKVKLRVRAGLAGNLRDLKMFFQQTLQIA
jgi:hypothetical protein